jgi:hypothetical protein
MMLDTRLRNMESGSYLLRLVPHLPPSLVCLPQASVFQGPVIYGTSDLFGAEFVRREDRLLPSKDFIRSLETPANEQAAKEFSSL